VTHDGTYMLRVKQSSRESVRCADGGVCLMPRRRRTFERLGVYATALTMCLLVSSCARKEDLVVWRTQVTSPDGSWVASADTVQNGGFGSGYIETTVYLKRGDNHLPPFAVLGFSCAGPVPHPYALDNLANRGGTINLKMQWSDPLHLYVTYCGDPSINLETIKLQDVSITLQRESWTEGAGH
jgi:hypothetical protein